MIKDIKEKTYDKLYKVAEEGISNKKKRGEKFKEVREEYLSNINEDEEFDEFLFGKYFHDIEKEAIRNSVLDKKIRKPFRSFRSGARLQGGPPPSCN